MTSSMATAARVLLAAGILTGGFVNFLGYCCQAESTKQVKLVTKSAANGVHALLRYAD